MDARRGAHRSSARRRPDREWCPLKKYSRVPTDGFSETACNIDTKRDRRPFVGRRRRSARFPEVSLAAAIILEFLILPVRHPGADPPYAVEFQPLELPNWLWRYNARGVGRVERAAEQAPRCACPSFCVKRVNFMRVGQGLEPRSWVFQTRVNAVAPSVFFFFFFFFFLPGPAFFFPFTRNPLLPLIRGEKRLWPSRPAPVPCRENAGNFRSWSVGFAPTGPRAVEFGPSQIPISAQNELRRHPANCVRGVL